MSLATRLKPSASTVSTPEAAHAGGGGRHTKQLADRLWSERTALRRRRRIAIVALSVVLLAVIAVNLMFGQTFYGPVEIVQVISGEFVPGASFTVGELRLPRTTLGLVVGLSFGLAGVAFQTLLRNPLASPDILGITEGASAAAAVAIVTFGLSGGRVSVVAVIAGLAVAAAMYFLARRGSLVGARLILIGIGLAAMMRSVVAWQLGHASNPQLSTAMRWLNGSLNSASWRDVIPVAVALVVLGGVILTQTRRLTAASLGDDLATALGVPMRQMRLIVILAAVGLICIATASCGPIAFVAFLAGPIASRLIGKHGSVLIPGALVGALLVLSCDFAGQYLFPNRFPVGVITGLIGAPFLLTLIVRINRTGAI